MNRNSARARAALLPLALACFLALPRAQGQGARGADRPGPVKAAAPDALDRAGALLDAGDSAGAERLCRAFLSGHDRFSSDGRSASYLLVSALRAEGRPVAALAEADSLLRSLREHPAPAGPDDVSADEVAALRDTLRGEAPQNAESRQNQGAAGGEAPGAASRSHVKAYERLSADTAAAPAARLPIERAYLDAVSQQPAGTRRPALAAFAARIAGRPDASPPERGLALGALEDLAGDGPQTPESERLERTARADFAAPASTPDGLALRVQAGKILYRLDLRAAIRAAAGAVKDEEGSDWRSAAAGYREVVRSCDDAEAAVGHADRFVSLLLAEAARSAPLMEGLAAPPAAPDPAGCAFLGVDRTVGPDWAGTLGTEGWVLFAPHGGDLCGGPRVLDGSFSYRLYLGDPANQVRRWRDPPGPDRFPGADLPLADPGVPGEAVISYLDDNGEAYPKGAGPDLYVGLSVPAGRHLLTLPLHYDLHVPEARYGLYLLAGGGKAGGAPAEGGPPRCVASLIVSAHDEPGMARLRVSGPARYTLLMRRLSGENANLPALFLDADPASSAPAPLSDAFAPAELASAGVAGTGAEADDSRGKAPGDPALLRDAARRYGQGRLTQGGWSDLAGVATRLSDSGDLDAGQRAVAAWIAWQAQERAPLQAGGVTDAFRRYLGRRFPLAPDGAARDAQVLALRAMSARMRGAGRLALAEAADDAAWDRQAAPIRTAGDGQSSYASASVADPPTRLWDEGVRAYLAPETVWLWQGEDGPPPQRLAVALDAAYAARKSAALMSLLLAGGAGSALPRGFDDPAADRARDWLDVLAQRLGLSLGGDVPSPWDNEAASGALLQPFGPVVYAAACRPLLGGTGVPDAAAPAAAPDPLLLRPDQIELLARCDWDRDLFATERQVSDRAEARRLIGALRAQNPPYPRLALVESLLSAPDAH